MVSSLAFVWLLAIGGKAYAANTRPVATAFAASATEDTVLTLDLTPYASDADGDALTFYKSSVYKGTVSITTAGIATFTPTANYNGTAGYFYFYVKDSQNTTNSTSTAAKVSLTITAVNDAPTASAKSVTTNEDTAKSVTMSATDPETEAITYSIVSGASHGSLGTVSAASVTYTPVSNYYGADSFTYQATDASGNVSGAATVSITVSSVNDKPTLSAVPRLTTNEDNAVTVDLAPYASDTEGQALSFYATTSVYKGTISITAAGIATFTPTANYNGTAGYFYFYARDSAGGQSVSTRVSVTVNAVNDAPVAASGSATLGEDASASITLSATDAESNALTYQIVDAPSRGTATLSTRTVTYVPNANENGPDTFTFKAYETAATSSVSNTATVSLTVTPVNDAPTAADVTAITDENVPAALTLNAADVDGDTLTYTFASPAGGSVTQTDGIATYTPTTAYSGTDTFAYTASDGTLAASANVAVTVTPINETPIAVDDSATLDEDTSATVTLSATDGDGDALTYAIASGSSNGSVTLSGDQATYVPTGDYNGTDSFTFTASDGVNTSAAATVSLTIVPVDEPVGGDFTSAMTEDDSSVVIDVGLPESNNGDRYATCTATPSHGYLSTHFNSCAYHPDENYSGADEFAYSAIIGSVTATGTIHVDIVPVNDAPVASGNYTSTDQDTPVTITLSSADPDDGDTATYAIATEPGFGTVSLSGNQVTYTPNTGESGRDSFTFSVTDTAGLSDTSALYVTVGNNNDAPTVEDISAETAENTPVDVVLLGSDPDNDELTYFVTVSEDGTTEVSGSTLSFTPDHGFDGTATVLYQATDGGRSVSNTGTLTITVSGGSNDAPTAENGEETINEDKSAVIALVAADPENTALTYSIGTSPAHGSITLSGDEATYVPEPNFYGGDSFTFTASDGVNTSNVASVTFTVNPVADPVIECDGEMDPSHIQTETDSTSGRSTRFVDNQILVVMGRIATEDEMTEMKNAIGSTSTACSIEQTQLTEAEADGLIDTAETGYGFYMFEVPTQTAIADLDGLAASLRSLSYVNSASFIALDNVELRAAESDAELYGYQSRQSIQKRFLKWIQLKGGLDYLRAYQEQGGHLYFVAASMGDSGVCASSYGGCASVMSGITSEYSGFIFPGQNFIGTLADPSRPLGLVDELSDYHGTYVASLMTAASNGAASSPDMSGTDFGTLNYPYSGVMGSVRDLNYSLTSYLLTGWDDSIFSNYNKNYANSLWSNTVTAMCGDDIVNFSVGPESYSDLVGDASKIQNAITTWKSVGMNLANCPQTLFVNAASEEGNNYSSATDTEAAAIELARAKSPVTGAYYPNVIEVGAAGQYSYEPSDYSDFGEGITVIAPGEATSYATPIVSGTAGILNAIDKSLSPADLKSLLEESGKPNNKGTAFLDVSSATLLAIKDKKPDYAPMSLKLLSTSLDKNLSDLRSADGYSGGTHNETGNWKFENKTLTIERTATETSADGAPGPNAGESDTYYDWQMESKLDSRERFDVGLSQIADGSRQVPVGVFMPKGSQSHKLSGKFHAYHSGDETVEDLMVEDHAQSYCFQLDYNLNPNDAAKDGGGFHVPLARDSSSPSHIVPYKISGATLTGNVVKKVYNYWNPETTYDEGVPNTAETSGDETGYAEMTPPSCSEDITANLEENSATFDSWAARIEAIESDQVGEWVHVEKNGIWIHPEIPPGTETTSCAEWPTVIYQATDTYSTPTGISCHTDDPPLYPAALTCLCSCGGVDWSPNCPTTPPDCTSTYTCSGSTPVYGCGINLLESDSPWAPEEVEVDMHVSATFADVNCALTMTSVNGDLNPSDTDTVEVATTSDYLQTFKYSADDAGSVLCTATATVNATTVFQREYDSADWSPCDIGTMTRVLKSEDSFSVDVTWNFDQGEFPAKDFFTEFEAQLGTIVDDYQTWLEEDFNHNGNPDSYYFQSPFDYLGTNESHILPETLLFGAFQTPGFGFDMDDVHQGSLHWAHGIGPVKNFSGANAHDFQITGFRKLDRTVR